ncbi:hypothetical protein TTHERM_002653503, partial (macronuclear) [Tetrahymena thermophila SB210]
AVVNLFFINQLIHLVQLHLILRLIDSNQFKASLIFNMIKQEHVKFSINSNQKAQSQSEKTNERINQFIIIWHR